MIKKLTLLVLVCLSANFIQAQTLEELKTKKAEIEGMQAAKQAEADGFQGEIDALAKEIEVLSGWQTGLNGLVGLNIGNSNNWAANANRNSSSSTLNLGVNAFANNIQEKTFWRNSLVANVGWQGLDNDTKDDSQGSSFLGDRNTDLLIGTSLWGYRLNQDIAISAMGDFNSSVFNFLNPGSLDVGVGITWTPSSIPNLVFVIHPLTYHIGWTGGESKQNLGQVGAKIKGTYTHEFPGGITWSSNLGAFVPYGDKKVTIPASTVGSQMFPEREAGGTEWTWINSLALLTVLEILH